MPHNGRSCYLTKTKIDELSSFSDNLTLNFNSLLGIVYVSFSIDEYVAISHRYDLKRISLKS